MTVPEFENGLWTVDPQGSRLRFAVKGLWGVVTVRGQLAVSEGSLRVMDRCVVGVLTIDAASVDTRNRMRDRHLRSADFLDVERHPWIVFAASSTAVLAGRRAIIGDLAIGAARLRLSIPVELERAPDGALSLAGRVTISRTSTGMTWNRLGSIDDPVAVDAQLTLRRENG